MVESLPSQPQGLPKIRPHYLSLNLKHCRTVADLSRGWAAPALH